MLKKLLITLFLASAALATVPSAETKRQYFTCNGSITTFTFTTPCNSSDDIQVILRLISTGEPTPQTEDTDYSIAYTGSSYLEGGVVTMGTAPASTYQLVIVREIVQTQETSSGAVNHVSVEAAFDKLTRQIQDIRYDLRYRYFGIPQSDADTLDMQYPNSISRADRNFTWDSDGNPTATTQLNIGSANISAWGRTLADDLNAAKGRETIGVAIGTDVQAYDADLDKVAANDYTADMNFLDLRVKGPWADVRAFGADPTGTDDSYTEIQAAIDSLTSGGYVLIPEGTYLTSDELIIDVEGVKLWGLGGNTGVSEIQGTKTSGAIVRIKRRSCGVIGVKLSASAARFAATTTTGHGIHIETADVADTGASRPLIRDVWIYMQPTDGIYTGTGIELGLFDTMSVQDCQRHGYNMDDGTGSGRTNKDKAPWEVTINRCRAIECAGNALLVGAPGDTKNPRYIELNKFEALGCAWDPSKRVEDYQVILRSLDNIVTLLDCEDQQYANTTSQQGNARTAHDGATPTNGIKIYSSGMVMRSPHFSSLVSSIAFGTGNVTDITIENPSVALGVYAVAQTTAITVPTTVANFVFRGTTQTGATDLLQNQSAKAQIFEDNEYFLGTAITVSDYEKNSAGDDIYIATNILTANQDLVFIKGQGDALDDLSTIRLSTVVDGYAGLKMTLVNTEVYTITVKHGVDDILTKTGADVSLTQNLAISFVFDGTNWMEI